MNEPALIKKIDEELGQIEMTRRAHYQVQQVMARYKKQARAKRAKQNANSNQPEGDDASK